MRSWTLGAVVAAFATAGMAVAQSADIQVKANVYQALTISGARNLDFGDVFPGVDKAIALTDLTSGRFDVTGQAGSIISLTFTLPNGGNYITSGANQLPMNSWTACWDLDNAPAAGCTAFDPLVGTSAAAFGAGNNNMFIFLAATVAPASNQASGAYDGTARLTIAYVSKTRRTLGGKMRDRPAQPVARQARSRNFLCLDVTRIFAPLALIVLTALFINLRFMMYSASLRQHLGHLPLRWKLPLAYMLADNPYALCIARFTDHPADPHKFEFYLGADNLLDNLPPYFADIASSAGQDTDAGTYDALGRRFYAGVRLQF